MADENHLSRRQFLIQNMAILGGVLISGGLVAESLNPLESETIQTQFKLGVPQQFKLGSVTYFALAQAWLVRDRQGFYALKAVCTHLGCLPQWQNERFQCPCHGSYFNKSGEVKLGPARRALERYALWLGDTGEIIVDTSQVYLAERGEWQEPAAFLVYSG